MTNLSLFSFKIGSTMMYKCIDEFNRAIKLNKDSKLLSEIKGLIIHKTA
jgi:hypothetical protein